MNRYKMPNGRTYFFADNEVPEGAVLIKAVEPENKARKPAARKVRKPAKKKAVK